MKGTSPTRKRARPARHRSAKIEMWLFNPNSRGEVMDKVTTVGIDLAKSVFSLHGVDGAGRVLLRRTVRRDQLIQTVAALSPCLIGMEACSGAHERSEEHTSELQSQSNLVCRLLLEKKKRHRSKYSI